MNTQLTHVTLSTRANVYFDGRCISHTVLCADGARKSVGVIFPSLLCFQTDAAERMDIQAGRCRVRLAGQESWKEYTAGDHFAIPAHSQFEIETLELLDYVCHFAPTAL